MEPVYPIPLDNFLRRRHEAGEIKLRPVGATYKEFLRASYAHYEACSPRHQELLPVWLNIGWSHPWIPKAWDPPFTYLSFSVCTDLDDLTEKIFLGNASIGISFVLEEFCFINLVEYWAVIQGATWVDLISIDPHEKHTSADQRKLRKIFRLWRPSYLRRHLPARS